MAHDSLKRISPWWRAAIVGSCTAVASSAAHSFAGGTLPSGMGAFVVTIALVLLAFPVSRVRMSLRRWALVLTLWQGLAHCAWSVAGFVSAAGVSSGGHHHGDDGMSAELIGVSGAASWLPMLGAHLVGVAVTAFLASALDNSVARLRSWLAPLWVGVLRTYIPVAGRDHSFFWLVPIVAHGRRFEIPVDRGPPV